MRLIFVQLKKGTIVNADNVDSIYEHKEFMRHIYDDLGDERLIINTVGSRRIFAELIPYSIEEAVSLIEENSGPCDIPKFIKWPHYDTDPIDHQWVDGVKYINPSCVGRFTKGSIVYSDLTEETHCLEKVNIEEVNSALQNKVTLPHSKFIKVEAIYDDDKNLSYDRYLNIAHIAEITSQCWYGSDIIMRNSYYNIDDRDRIVIWVKDSPGSIIKKINAYRLHAFRRLRRKGSDK